MLLSLGGHACSSLDDKPDSAALVESPDCEIVSGQFRVRSEEDGLELATRIFGEDLPLVALGVEQKSGQVILRGTTTSEQVLQASVAGRFSCRNSVLTLLLADEGYGGAIVAQADSTTLELFAHDTDTLNLRFIDSALTFVLLVPVFRESDESFIVDRIRTDMGP